jgi:hypothetical protein
MADLTDQIEDAAASPKKVTGDAGSVEAHSLDELVKADQYLASKAAAQSSGRGLLLSQFKPPGTV